MAGITTSRVALLCAVFVAVGIGGVAATAGADTVSVAQDSECYELESYGDGTASVESFYDYRNSERGDQYSSYGTRELQEDQTSQLLFYNGSDGLSLVIVHDELDVDEDDGGGAVSMAFTGLPADGAWAVQDDNYRGSDDQWVHGDDETRVDWLWGAGRTDGGAFRGLESEDYRRITIEPAFNEAAALSDDATGDIGDWQVRDADGATHDLEMTGAVTVWEGICNRSPPDVDLEVHPDDPCTETWVALDASGTTDDGDIRGYWWDVTGDGTINTRTTDPAVSHSYRDPGEYEPTVYVKNDGRSVGTASTTVTVESDEDSAGCADTVNPESVTVESITSNDTDILVGDTVALTATLTNDGAQEETAVARFHLAGEPFATRVVTIPAGDSRSVTVTHEFEQYGTTTVGVNDEERSVTIAAVDPTFEVVDLSVSEDRIRPGESVTVEATIENVGRTDGTHTAALQVVADVVATEDVTIPAGETRTVSFTHEFDRSGTYTVAVGNQQHQVRVEAANNNPGPINADGAGAGVSTGIVAIIVAIGARRLWGRRP